MTERSARSVGSMRRSMRRNVRRSVRSMRRSVRSVRRSVSSMRRSMRSVRSVRRSVRSVRSVRRGLVMRAFAEVGSPQYNCRENQVGSIYLEEHEGGVQAGWEY